MRNYFVIEVNVVDNSEEDLISYHLVSQYWLLQVYELA